MFTVILSLLSLPVLGVFLCLLANYISDLFSPLRGIPGPFWARLTDGWYFWRVWRGHFEEENIHLHQKYGPVVRYGVNRYSFDDPEASKIIYGHGSHFAKSSWYSAWVHSGQWTIFTDQNIARHSQNRKLYQSTYSMSSLMSYEGFVDECADIFLKRMGELSETGLSINMGHWFQCYAFDVIGAITYSKRLGFLDRGEDIGEVIAALEDLNVYASLVGIFPGLHYPVSKLRDLLSGGQGKARTYVLNFTKKCIAEHQSKTRTEDAKPETPDNDKQPMDFLSKFYARHSANPEIFTMYHILVGCSSNMVAGSDTTAISISATLYYMLKHPRVFRKLRDEVDGLEKPSDWAPITFLEAQSMPYLQAVIKEALRLHPAVGLPLERVVPEGGATISGRFFPEGTIVGINCWVENRNLKAFGPDPEAFRPERWLDTHSDRLMLMNRHWIPFGMGSRTCIGRHISILEMSKLIPRLVRNFDFELCSPAAPWKKTNAWFVKPRDFKVTVRLRRPEGEKM
ncbi:cytochrome P450 [Xylariaceae sp. FL0662B]|nr:cytochrome P450 [Xylariaceae sp. FL0662B]